MPTSSNVKRPKPCFLGAQPAEDRPIPTLFETPTAYSVGTTVLHLLIGTLGTGVKGYLIHIGGPPVENRSHFATVHHRPACRLRWNRIVRGPPCGRPSTSRS